MRENMIRFIRNFGPKLEVRYTYLHKQPWQLQVRHEYWVLIHICSKLVLKHQVLVSVQLENTVFYHSMGLKTCRLLNTHYIYCTPVQISKWNEYMNSVYWFRIEYNNKKSQIVYISNCHVDDMARPDWFKNIYIPNFRNIIYSLSWLSTFNTRWHCLHQHAFKFECKRLFDDDEPFMNTQDFRVTHQCDDAMDWSVI